MTVRLEHRRGKRRLVLDIRYTNPDGSPGRFRHDAEVQTMAGAKAELRRRLATLAMTGSPESPNAGTLNAAPAPSAGAWASPVASGMASRAKTDTVEAQDPDSIPFSELADRYLKEYAVTRLKPSTKRGYEILIRSFLVPRIGDVPINRIDSNTAQSLDRELVERGLRPSSRLQVQAVLRSILRRFAIEAGLLESAPTFPRLPKVGRSVVTTLTEEEFARVLDKANGTQKLALLLAAHAGLRSGEIRGLRWQDVDLRARHLVVRHSMSYGVLSTPKSGHQRIIPLTDALHAALEVCPKKKRDDYVALSERQEPWSEHALLNAFRRACKRAGISGWRFHDLRHYFVSELFRRDVAAPTVQALAGHAELTTTQRYAHVARRDLENAIRRLERREVGNERATGHSEPKNDTPKS